MTLALLAALAVSGAHSCCVAHPLDTLRARLMTSRSDDATLLPCIRRLVVTNGVRGVYRGFGVYFFMQAPAIATYLTTYERAKAPIVDSLGLSSPHSVVHLSSDMTAATLGTVLWVPVEAVKQRAEVCGSSPLKVSGEVLRHEVPRAFLKCYAVTVAVLGLAQILSTVLYCAGAAVITALIAIYFAIESYICVTKACGSRLDTKLDKPNTNSKYSASSHAQNPLS